MWICAACSGKSFSIPLPEICGACGVRGLLFPAVAPEHGQERIGPPAPLSFFRPARSLEKHRTETPIDRLTGGGIPLGTGSVFYGPAGAGKSSLLLSALTGLSRNLDAPGLYVCPEMSRELALALSARAGIRGGRVLWSAHPEHFVDEAELAGANVVLIDSLSRMPRGTMRIALDFSQRMSAIVLMLAHENARGRAAGGAGTVHDPDAVFRLSLAAGERTLELVKSRFGGEPGTVPISRAAGDLPNSARRSSAAPGAATRAR